MPEECDHIVMFHGTSSVFLDAIMEHGLQPTPPARLSSLMMTNPDGHTSSFDGVYLSTMPRTAESYANQAAKHFGGEPLIVTVIVPVADLVPDEDELLYHLNTSIAYALDWDSNEDVLGELSPWTMAAAQSSVRWTLREHSSQAQPQSIVEPAAEALHDMATAAIQMSGKSTTWLFDPYAVDETHGWSSPRWIRTLVATPEGMKIYRDGMDRLSRAFMGVQPREYPCGTEGCKGRLLRPLGPATEGAFIAAVGSAEDLYAHYDNRDAGEGIYINPEAADWVAMRSSRALALAG